MSMNRRALFGATVAVAALAAPAVTVAAPGDAELDRLFAALQAAGLNAERANDAWTIARERYEEMIGEPPQVLRKIGFDYAAGLPIGSSLASNFHDDIDAAREALARNEKLVLESKGIFNVRSRDRCKKVVAALEERDALMDAAFVRAGVGEAHIAAEKAEDAEDDIRAEIHHYRPRTLAGLQRKAAFIAARIGEEGGLNAWQAAWARTLVEDVQALVSA